MVTNPPADFAGGLNCSKEQMAKSESQQDILTSCPSPLKINIIGINRDNKEAIIFNPGCKKWDCEFCGEQNANWWVYTGMRGAMILQSEGYLLRFVTVTSRNYATDVTSLHYFSENWPKLTRRAKYHTEKIEGQRWGYLLIPERTKAGILHAHLIAVTTLTERWWKDNAYQTGFGYMAKSKPLKDPIQAAQYCAKYLGKDVLHTGWPKGFRRARTSRNWPTSKPAPLEGWEWSQHSDDSAWFEKHILIDAGYNVKDKRAT